MLKIIRQFDWQRGAFALKSFVAAILALYIAMRLNLSQPSWAVTTVYIVSQPFAGMVLAKSFYRILGTLIGAAASLGLVALFCNTPELFCLALAAWIGLGTFITIYLRDEPRAYVGMLAGYSAAIIGLAAALSPDNAFAIAVERCLEITIGIACATLFHHVVVPQRAGDAMLKALDAALPAMARWAGDSLKGESDSAKGLRDRRGIIASVVTLDAQRVFAVLDTPALRRVDPMIRRFEGMLMSLLARLISVYDRFAILEQHRPDIADDLRPLLARAASHIHATAQARSVDAAEQEAAGQSRLEAEITARMPPAEQLTTHPDALLVRSILLALNQVLSMWRDAVSTRVRLFLGSPVAPDQPTPSFHPYRDVALAAIGAALTMVAVLLSASFWILSSWPNGETAVIFAAIVCAVMAARDNAVAASTSYLRWGMVGAAIAALYLFVVLPPLSTFPALVLALAPFYLVCGLLLSRPATASIPMPILFVGGALIGLSNSMSYDFSAFLNNTSGYAVGIGIAAATLALLRPLGADWTIRRQMRGIDRDLAQVAACGAMTRTAFESRMFDRLNALLMRLDPVSARERALLRSALGRLRIGINILGLHNLKPALPAAAQHAVATALAALAGRFATPLQGADGEAALAMVAASRARIFALGSSSDLIRAGEALYRIEATLRPSDPTTPQSAAPLQAATDPAHP
ncbi:MAG: FUSC family protein [Alphaproteobacteria bacterium]|nr:FUSC family protein [Alphaproteobacteria bacterium]